MAPSNPALLDTTTDGAGGSSLTSGSISPSNNCLLVIAFTGRRNDNTAISVSSISTTLSNVGSWTIVQRDEEKATGLQQITAVAYALVSGSPGTGTITVNHTADVLRRSVHVAETTGHDTSTPVPQNATSDTNTVTLSSSPASDSIVFGAVSSRASGIGPGTGFTEIAETTPGGGAAITCQTQYDNGSASTTCDWSGTSNPIGVAIEIAAAAAAGQPMQLRGQAVPHIGRQWQPQRIGR